jgi:hypothetical protein
MTLYTMRDFLTEKVADYEFLLDIPATVSMPEVGDKTQEVHKFDDGSVDVASLSDTSFFEVEIQWDVLTQEDAGIILDLWHNSNKANGRERTFYWENPKDGFTYVVRFMEPVRVVSQHTLGDYVTIERTVLRVEGFSTAYYYGS